MLSNKATRYYSNAQEKKIAKTIGGKRTVNSGAGKFQKGDCENELFLVECKTCTQPKLSFTIKKDWLTKNKEEAFEMGKLYNALAFDFGDGTSYFVIDESLFRYLNEKLEEEENA